MFILKLKGLIDTQPFKRLPDVSLATDRLLLAAGVKGGF
jgi:hypothetical protein